MTKRSTYAEMLLDPRWQRKRLEVLQAADFKCRQCGSGEKTLHVHHMHYERGKKPWEYELRALRCLCEDCHFSTQDLQAEIARNIARLEIDDLPMVLGFVAAMSATSAFGRGLKSSAIPISPTDDEGYVMGVGQFFFLDYRDVLSLVEDGQVLAERALHLAKQPIQQDE